MGSEFGDRGKGGGAIDFYLVNLKWGFEFTITYYWISEAISRPLNILVKSPFWAYQVEAENADLRE